MNLQSAETLARIVNENERLSSLQTTLFEDSLDKSRSEKAQLESERLQLQRELSSLYQKRNTLSSFGRTFSTITSVTNGVAAAYLTTATGSLFPAFVLTATLVNEALKRYNGWERLYAQFTSSKPLQEKLAFVTESALSVGSAYFSVSSCLQAGNLVGSAMQTMQSAMLLGQGFFTALKGETQYQTKKREAFSTKHTAKIETITGKASRAASNLKKTTDCERGIFEILSRISSSCLDLQLPLYAATPV